MYALAGRSEEKTLSELSSPWQFFSARTNQARWETSSFFVSLGFFLFSFFLDDDGRSGAYFLYRENLFFSQYLLTNVNELTTKKNLIFANGVVVCSVTSEPSDPKTLAKFKDSSSRPLRKKINHE